jgi:hypothetical protein
VVTRANKRTSSANDAIDRYEAEARQLDAEAEAENALLAESLSARQPPRVPSDDQSSYETVDPSSGLDSESGQYGKLTGDRKLYGGVQLDSNDEAVDDGLYEEPAPMSPATVEARRLGEVVEKEDALLDKIESERAALASQPPSNETMVGPS